MPKPKAGFDPDFPYRLSESQHDCLYQTRHLLELMHDLALNGEEFCDIRSESIAVTFGLMCDLLDQAMPNLIWRKPQ